jgi:hypothetical protein
MSLNGGGEDDRAGGRGREHRQCRLCAVEVAHQVDVDLAAHLLDRHLLEQEVARRSSVRMEGVDPTEGLANALERRTDALPDRDVAGDGKRHVTELTGDGGHTVSVAVQQGDPIAGLCKGSGTGKADSGGRSRDHRDPLSTRDHCFHIRPPLLVDAEPPSVEAHVSADRRGPSRRRPSPPPPDERDAGTAALWFVTGIAALLLDRAC